MNASYSGPLWHVVQVEPWAELRVAKDIRDELGFPTYVPCERVWRVKRGRKIDAARPLFSGYDFVQVHPYRQEWQALLGIEGIVDVLGRPAIDTHGMPSHVPAAWVEMIRKMEDCGVFDRTKAEPDKFKLGETVRISDGIFAGFNAEIQGFVAKMRSATAKKRAKLLVQFMGRMCAAELDVTALEKL